MADPALYADLRVASLPHLTINTSDVVWAVSREFYEDFKLKGADTNKNNQSLQGDLRDSLKPGLVYDSDYVIVQGQEWEKMKPYCRPSFQRHIIRKGIKAELFIELYPFSIRLYKCNELGEADKTQMSEFFISQQSTWQSFINTMAKREPAGEAGVAKKMRLWRQPRGIKRNTDKTWILLNDDRKMEKVGHGGYHPSENILLLLEIETKDGWRRKKKVRDWGHFKVNDVVDAKDKDGTWFESTIRDVKEGEIFVHYRGCSNTADEWIKIDSDRLAKKGTHTTGPVKRRSRGYSDHYRSDRRDKPIARGIVGLQNLGNTCYMNSALQCLLQLPRLGDYFYDEQYRTDINRQNPLGWQGQVADTFGEFVKRVYSDAYSVIAPKSVLSVMRQINSQFEGFNQHDSQEFLSFLLDALHEDLNRVQNKPATQEIEGHGRADEIVAKEAWDTHLLRHDSMIQDNLCGQFRSIITCPTCNRVSKKFDPFWVLTVPLPENTSKLLEVTWMGANLTNSESSPITLGIKCKVTQPIKFIKETLSKKFNVEEANLVACDIWNRKVYRTFLDTHPIGEVTDNDALFIFHSHKLPCDDNLKEIKEWVDIPVVHNHFVKSSSQSYRSSQSDPFTNPMILRLPCETEISADQLKSAILKQIEPFLKAGWTEAEKEDELYNVKLLEKNGRSCYYCEWSKYCPGCDMKDKPISIKSTSIRKKDQAPMIISVVWTETGEKFFGHERYTEPARDESAPEAKSLSGKWKKKAETPVSLEKCLDLFTKEETLDEVNQWYCSNCKEFKCAQKQMDIWKLPPICVVHLKRFSSFGGMFSQKNSRPVEYPLELDFKKWVLGEKSSAEKCVYQLCGVVRHLGGLGGGHYIATAKSQCEGSWYLLNDDSVKKVKEESAQNSDAYMLFYARKGILE